MGWRLSVGEEGSNAWSLRVTVGPPSNGVRSVDIRADKVSAANILLALRVKELTYNADLVLSGELKGELGRDGCDLFPRQSFLRPRNHHRHRYAGLSDGDRFDRSQPGVDAGRRVLVAPFKITSGPNKITLLAHLEPPNDSVTDWQLGFSGGTIILAGFDNEPPLIFNRIAINLRFDTDKKRVLLTQADISNGDVGVAGSGSVDYAGEARLQLGLAGTPMSTSASSGYGRPSSSRKSANG